MAWTTGQKRRVSLCLEQLESRETPSTSITTPLTVLSFEGLHENTSVGTSYKQQGVTFTSATVLTESSSLNPSFPPESPPNVVYNFPKANIIARAVGGNWSSVGGYVTGNRVITMTAYSSTGAIVGSTSTTGPNYTGGGGGSPNELLRITGSNIARVTFFGGRNNTFTIDNFFFQQTIALQITIPQNQTVFDITASPAPRMPNLKATAALVGGSAAGVQLQWTVTIGLPAEGDGRAISTVSFTKTSTGKTVNFHGSDWRKLIRGGEVTISVSAVVKGQLLQASLGGLEIVGENPTAGQIEAFIDKRAVPAKYPAGTQYSYSEVIGDIVKAESNNQQFVNGLPNWSSDGQFRAGLMQVKAATDAQVWNWQANVSAGIALFNKELNIAAGYAAKTAHKLAGQLKSLAKKLHLSQVVLGTFTPDDVVREAIQLFNGGNDYVPQRDPNGKLHVNISGSVGTVPWIEVGDGFVTRVLG